MLPWRDTYGREHAEIARCEAYGKKRRYPWDNGRPCTRKGLRKRVDAPGWRGEHFFCDQHDPARPKAGDLQMQVRELRAALAAVLPAARYGVRAAEPMEAQIGARGWRKAVRRADDLVEGT